MEELLLLQPKWNGAARAVNPQLLVPLDRGGGLCSPGHGTCQTSQPLENNYFSLFPQDSFFLSCPEKLWLPQPLEMFKARLNGDWSKLA